MLYCLRKKKSLFSLYYTSGVILLCTDILELLKLLLLSISLYVLSFFSTCFTGQWGTSDGFEQGSDIISDVFRESHYFIIIT